MGSDGKRRLKVLQPKDDDDGEARPPWHWSAIGAVAIFLVWLPLAYLSQLWVQARYAALGTPEQAAEAFRTMSPLLRLSFGLHTVLGPILSLVLACLAGGMFVARFGGGAGAGSNEAMAAGLAVAGIASLIGAWQMLPSGAWDAWGLSAAVMLVAAGAAARIGAWVVVRKR